MSIFNDFSSFASDLANKAGRKTKVVASTTKLNMKIAGQEDIVKKAYSEIGRLYYEAYELGETVNLDSCVPHCEAVSEAKQQIAEIKDEIERIKQADKDIDERESREKAYSEQDAEYVDIFDDQVPAAEDEVSPEDSANAPVDLDE